MQTEWSSDLSTGVEAIDAQHREFLRRIAQLRAAASQGQLHRASDMLEYLGQYASRHFSTEERFMEASGYPGLADHRSAHLAFAAELGARKAEFTSTGSLARLMLDLCDWLTAWVNDHVRQVDKVMAEHLRLATPAP